MPHPQQCEHRASPHPLGLAAALALSTVAGSYRAASSNDGFVPVRSRAGKALREIKEHSVTASDVNTELRAIRDMLSADIFTDNIQRHGLDWDMACASMDMIGDTQLAIDAFNSKPVSEGQRLT
jgi:hypothetical protein